MEKWMETNATKIGDLKLNEIILPGTHNSGTHTMKSRTHYSLDAPSFLHTSKILSVVSKNIVTNLAVCQTRTISEQLMDGIRYLDFRISADHHNKLGHISHALKGQAFVDVIQEIIDFLHKNQKEIVILDIKRILGYKDISFWIQGLVDYLKDQKVDFLCPLNDTEITISKLWNQNHRFVLILPFEEVPSPFWPYNSLYRAWANSPHCNQIIDYIESHRCNKKSNSLHLSEYIVTVNVTTIILNPTSTLEKLSLVLHDEFHKSIQKGIQEKSVNLVCIDFYTPEFIKLCIEANLE